MSAAAENSPRNRNSPRLIRKSPTPKFPRTLSRTASPTFTFSPPPKKALPDDEAPEQRLPPLKHQTLSTQGTPKSEGFLSPGSARTPGYARSKSPRTPRSRRKSPRSPGKRISGPKGAQPYFKRYRSPRQPVFPDRPDRPDMRKATPQQGFAPPLRTVSTITELDEACGDIRINDVSLKQLRVVSVSDGPHWLRMKGALRRNTSLEELELLRTRVESNGLEHICPVLGALKSFKSFVICEDYSIYRDGWKSIADMMIASKSLEFMSVWVPSHSVRACIDECKRGILESSANLKTFEMHHHAGVELDELQPLIDALEATPHIRQYFLPRVIGDRQPVFHDKTTASAAAEDDSKHDADNGAQKERAPEAEAEAKTEAGSSATAEVSVASDKDSVAGSERENAAAGGDAVATGEEEAVVAAAAKKE